MEMKWQMIVFFRSSVESVTVMERVHLLRAGARVTETLWSVVKTNWPTASSPGEDRFRSVTQDTWRGKCELHQVSQ